MFSKGKLTKEVAYLVGWWHLLKIKRGGIGIYGPHSRQFLELFSKYVHGIDHEQIKEKDGVFMYVGNIHGRGLLKKIERERDRKFRFTNEYSGMYLLALYQASRDLANMNKIELKNNMLVGDNIDVKIIDTLGYYSYVKPGVEGWSIIEIKRFDLFNLLISSVPNLFNQ